MVVREGKFGQTHLSQGRSRGLSPPPTPIGSGVDQRAQISAGEMVPYAAGPLLAEVNHVRTARAAASGAWVVRGGGSPPIRSAAAKTRPALEIYPHPQ